MSVVTLEAARHPVATPSYEIHINTLNGHERFPTYPVVQGALQ
jgi:hypothetical protein